MEMGTFIIDKNASLPLLLDLESVYLGTKSYNIAFEVGQADLCCFSGL